MKKLKTDCFNPLFSHIYVEKSILNHPFCGKILKNFPKAKVITIEHYKDVFNRRKQSYNKQNMAKNLILAQSHGSVIYKGAKVCQSFGNDNFYYTSCMRNCIFDCEYCYLKGMYPSGNMVIFINIEDTFKELQDMLKDKSIYLCVSYDTDLLAMEKVTGFVKEWIDFTKEHPNLTIEVRTKSGDLSFFKENAAVKNVIYAFTISPDLVVQKYEHNTASMESRIKAASYAKSLGHNIRLCFDPMIYVPDWKRHYEDMIDRCFACIDKDSLLDVSVGSFRISQDYLKKMRRDMPESSVAQFPYVNKGGVYQYPEGLMQEMEDFMEKKLLEYISQDKIFRWEDDNE